MKRRTAVALLAGLLAAPAGLAQEGSTVPEALTVPAGGLELPARLYRPAGSGPFPAVVMLHGCSGMWTSGGEVSRNYDHWARHLRARGFAALLVDSFGPRGEREICTQRERRVQPQRERSADAHAALHWLAARPDVDVSRIHLLGWSNGAMAALYALGRALESGQPGFRSAVAFYPGCRALVRVEYQPTAPVLILSGGSDDWTPAVHCEALAERARLMGHPVDIAVFAGAHHAFDGIAGGVRYRPDVRNPNSPTGRGATVGPHAQARAQAWAQATRFLEAPARVPRGTGAAGTAIP